MKTKDELKIGDIVWIFFKPDKEFLKDSFGIVLKNDFVTDYGIKKPIPVKVIEIYKSAVIVKPDNLYHSEITCYEGHSYNFYESYDEAIKKTLPGIMEIILILRKIANNLENDVNVI